MTLKSPTHQLSRGVAWKVLLSLRESRKFWFSQYMLWFWWVHWTWILTGPFACLRQRNNHTAGNFSKSAVTPDAMVISYDSDHTQSSEKVRPFPWVTSSESTHLHRCRCLSVSGFMILHFKRLLLTQYYEAFYYTLFDKCSVNPFQFIFCMKSNLFSHKV